MRVRSTSRSAAEALKVIAANYPNYPNNPAAVMSVNQRTKEKKEKIGNFCSFKYSSIFNLEFSLVFDNFSISVYFLLAERQR